MIREPAAPPRQSRPCGSASAAYLPCALSKTASVILATYNQPRALDLSLRGYARQSTRDFEIVIADDGSGPETAELIAEHARRFPVPVRHVWQEDKPFRKALACNRAVLQSEGAHLVFSDSDCIPSRTFVEEHLGARAPRRFIIGGHIRLPKDYTESLTPDEVDSGRFEEMRWTAQTLGLWTTHLKSLFYIATGKRRKPKFYGLNFSTDRASFFHVNGFDATFQGVGREDSDLRNRLQLGGIRARSLWHRARVYHQFHGVTPGRDVSASIQAHLRRADLSHVSPDGLRELAAELGTPLGS
jgi:glycosyltransferase involved in cell wall biosynthesis